MAETRPRSVATCHERWERADLNADRTWARAAAKLLRTAPPGCTVADDDGTPVVRRPRKTIAELRAAMQATAARWRAPERRPS